MIHESRWPEITDTRMTGHETTWSASSWHISSRSVLNSSSSPPQISLMIARPLVSSLMALLTALVARFVLRPAFRFRGVREQWSALGSLEVDVRTRGRAVGD